ncbi:MAG TPA: YciI family protein [Candidatus Angelobacter sp.]|nr:YciI family protein [Candidatus Angelobacter sp.]
MSTKYMFLIYADEAGVADATPEQWEEMLRAHDAWQASVTASGATIHGGDALAPSTAATTVRKDGGSPVVTDGPFAETKEALGGYYLVECADLDHALTLARTLPGPAVEVRPVIHTA